MSQSRVLLIAAVAAGALYLSGAIALGTPPDASDTPGQVLTWFRDHPDAAQFYAWTLALGTLAFAVVAGIVSGLLPTPNREIFLLGASAFIVETAVQGWTWAGLALHPATLEAATTRTIFDIASFWGPVLTGATTTMIGAVTALGLTRPKRIPNWLFVIGIVAFAEQAIETITVFGTSGFTAPGGDMNLLLGAGITAIWLGATVIWAARRPTVAPSAS